MRMAELLAQYACDTCRSRKVRCSRERSGCQRCKAEGITCSYSRSGVIRRSKKQKENNRHPTPPTYEAQNHETPASPERSGLRYPSQPPLDNAENNTTHSRLQGLMGKDHHSLKALASLLEEYAAAWQGSFAFDKLSESAQADFFLFEENQARVWADALVTTLQKERLLLTSVPSEVLDHLAASRPHRVRDRAWLVMFYSVALNVVSSTNPSDESTKVKVKNNLWLAFNDVRLLLEPNISSIQALVILACHVEEFMTPSVCWALINKACVMLQALGITNWRLDTSTRERRTMVFWRLNTLDKALALILCRPPTFNRQMTAEIALPTLDQFLPSQSRHSGDGAPDLFNAHYMHQMHLLSRVMADVWHCLYGQDSDKVHTIKENLESWHRQATEVLEAAAMAEKPLLTASGAASVDLGLRTLQFHYYSLLVVLTVSSKELRSQSAYPSRQMLQLLPGLGDMVPDLKEPYTCLLWQLLHCPMAAFGTLWGKIVTEYKTNFEGCKEALEAIEYLPTFLGKLSSRNSVAAKLESITGRILQHARMILYSQDEAQPNALNPAMPTQEMPDLRRPVGENMEQHSTSLIGLLNTEPSTIMSNIPSGENFDTQIDPLFMWPDDCFLDATFDWFAWGNLEIDGLNRLGG